MINSHFHRMRISWLVWTCAYLLTSTVIPVPAQDKLVTVDDFVGTWESKIENNDNYFAEAKITKIIDGIEVESKTRLPGIVVERKEKFYLDGRGESNKSPDGETENSVTEFKRDTITITYYYFDKKSGKKLNLKYKKYRVSKGVLIFTGGLIGYSNPNSPIVGGGELKFTRKPS